MKDTIFRVLFVRHFENLDIYSFHFAILLYLLLIFEINRNKNIHIYDFHCHVRKWKAFNWHEYFCEAKLQTNQATSKQDNRADCMLASEDKMQVVFLHCMLTFTQHHTLLHVSRRWCFGVQHNVMGQANCIKRIIFVFKFPDFRDKKQFL